MNGTTNTVVTNTVQAALEAAQRSYSEIAAARDELNALEARGVFVEGHLEERRQEAAARVEQAVEQLLDGAVGKIQGARSTLEARLEELRSVDPAQLALATTRFSLVFGGGPSGR